MSTNQSPPPATFYGSQDGDVAVLASKRVAVIGYGHLGRSVALNLADEGLDVVVGNIDDAYGAQAATDGFEVTAIASACTNADVVVVLLADETIPSVYDSDIAPALEVGATVVFASGYCLAYGLVSPAPDIDVVMVAPRMLGEEVRSCYLQKSGYVAYCSVEQDSSGTAQATMLAYAKATGALYKGAMALSAEKEALVDLLVEQTVGPYLGTAIQIAFALGTEAGLPPEALALELYASGEMSRTFAAFARDGFYRSVEAHGITATFGGFLRTMELDRAGIAEHFQRVIDDIAAGGFAKKLQEEMSGGYPTVKAIRAMTNGGDPMSHAEQVLRSHLGPAQS